MASDALPSRVPGAKMIYLIRRRASASREELVAHWFANHMPGVIAMQARAAERGKPHAKRYIATLFDADRDGAYPIDGMAQLWWDQAPPEPAEPHGAEPMDSFQQKAEPYLPWATQEYQVIDGAEHLDGAPLTLNAPYPTTRSGFFKVSFFVKAKSGTDFDAFFDHWLSVHAANVRGVMAQVGGFRYVISHSLAPADEPWAGLAELYFHDANSWDAYRKTIRPDGMERWVANDGVLVLRAQTEMVGIP